MAMDMYKEYVSLQLVDAVVEVAQAHRTAEQMGNSVGK
jgi:hypothetical protein